MSDDEFLDWEVSECDNCERTGHKTAWFDIHKIPEKWVCVGNIPKPNNPNDTHDLLNKVRICFTKSDKKIEQFEWTPYEASIVSLFLNMAVANELYEDQPYLDEENNLVHNSFRSETK